MVVARASHPTYSGRLDWITLLSLFASAIALTAGTVGAVLAVRATPQRLLASLKRAVREAELIADRLDALEGRFETHKVSTAEHVEAMEGLADRVSREGKRRQSRDKRAEPSAPVDEIAELRTRARAQGMPV